MKSNSQNWRKRGPKPKLPVSAKKTKTKIPRAKRVPVNTPPPVVHLPGMTVHPKQSIGTAITLDMTQPGP